MSGVLVWFKRFLLKSRLVRDVTLLAGGTALGQGAVVLASPILTRLYTPEDFGILAVYTSILGIVTVVASLRYELAIPLAKDNETAARLLIFSLAIVLGMSLLIGVGILFVGDWIVVWSNALALRSYLWLLPVGLFGSGMYQALNYWTAREKRFTLLGYTRALRAFGQVGIQTLSGVFGRGAFGLLIGFVVGQFLGVGSLLRQIRLPKRGIHLQTWIEVAKRYKNFPLYTTWASLVNVAGTQVPPVLFARYFSVDTAGFFTLTIRILGLPASLVGQAVGQVFYPVIAERNNDPEGARVMIERVATGLFVVAFPVFAVVGLWGPELFVIAFGEAWAEAGRFAQYLAPWLCLSFVSSPLSMFALVKEKQRQAFGITLYETFLRLFAVWMGRHWDSPDWAVKFYAGVSVIISIIYIGWVLRLAGSSIMHWLVKIQSFICGAFVLLIVLYFVKLILNFYEAVAVSVGSLTIFTIWFVRKI